MHRIRRDLDVARTTLLEHIFEDHIERVGPSGRVAGLDLVESGLGAGERAGHGGEGGERGGEVERVV
jgi:hypothetical protein